MSAFENTAEPGSAARDGRVCDLCHESRTTLALDLGARELRRCVRCGLVRLSPMPSAAELSEVYDTDEYYTQAAPKEGRSIADRLRNAVHEIFWGYPGSRGSLTRGALSVALLPLRERGLPVPFPDGRPVLDIGCGNGQLLLDLQNAGCTDLYGVEPTQGAAEQARRHTRARVHAGLLETADLPRHHFYLIVMNQVLEHVPSPSATLGLVRSLLRDDGYLYLTVPNFGSAESSAFGAQWSGLRIPAHLHHFTRSPLCALVEQAGFRITICRTDSVPSITASSAHDWGRARAGLVGRLVATIPRTALAATTLAADRLGRGQMLRVVAVAR